jgi:hypothetical protein
VQRSSLLLLGLGGAALLFALSRTEQGAQLASDAVESLAVSLLPKGIRNRNPGNLRFIARSPWNGQIGQDGTGFGVYSSMALGVRASARQLLKYQSQGARTVREIIAKWAPASENHTESYIKTVAAGLGVAADQRIDVSVMLPELAQWIFRVEVGAAGLAAAALAASPEDRLTTENIRAWVRL